MSDRLSKRRKCLTHSRWETRKGLLLINALLEANKPLPKDPKLTEFETALAAAEKPLGLPPEVTRLRRALSFFERETTG